ncbi:hypothetical protein ZEAMMB73_Zm00001d040175 [Zea mays]|uniref:Protein kinase domain-containing protein n=1 Tax=Zea mays TaxID=4577 RepID=A0A1D6MNQ4_MAIZE|nr:hypothetical protein ZEAMMB73_Zm00001d040175 [Zea mays]
MLKVLIKIRSRKSEQVMLYLNRRCTTSTRTCGGRSRSSVTSTTPTFHDEERVVLILEHATLGEINKILHATGRSIFHGRLTEVDARRYFQQLIDGVDFCHKKRSLPLSLKGDHWIGKILSMRS